MEPEHIFMTADIFRKKKHSSENIIYYSQPQPRVCTNQHFCRSVINCTPFNNLFIKIATLRFLRFSALWTASLMGGVYSSSISVIGRFIPASIPVFFVGAPGRARAGKADSGGGVCAGMCVKKHILRHVTAFYS